MQMLVALFFSVLLLALLFSCFKVSVTRSLRLLPPVLLYFNTVLRASLFPVFSLLVPSLLQCSILVIVSCNLLDDWSEFDCKFDAATRWHCLCGHTITM